MGFTLGQNGFSSALAELPEPAWRIEKERGGGPCRQGQPGEAVVAVSMGLGSRSGTLMDSNYLKAALGRRLCLFSLNETPIMCFSQSDKWKARCELCVFNCKAGLAQGQKSGWGWQGSRGKSRHEGWAAMGNRVRS